MKKFFFEKVMMSIVILFLITFSSFAQSKGKPATDVMSKENIEAVLKEAYVKFKDVKEGKNADYIKELANVDPNIFGISLVTADGKIYTVGDNVSMVSIQSISKAFVMAQIIEEYGHQAIQDKSGWMQRVCVLIRS